MIVINGTQARGGGGVKRNQARENQASYAVRGASSRIIKRVREAWRQRRRGGIMVTHGIGGQSKAAINK